MAGLKPDTSSLYSVGVPQREAMDAAGPMMDVEKMSANPAQSDLEKMIQARMAARRRAGGMPSGVQQPMQNAMDPQQAAMAAILQGK